MIVFLLFIAVLLIGLTAAAVMGRIGGFMADPTSSQAFSGVPAGSLSSDEIGQVRFDRALRGYRMDEVDEVLDALRARLRELETKVAPAPAEGAQGDPALAEGAQLPGEGAPMAGEGAPMAGEGAPMAGEGAPMAGEGAPMAGEGAPMAGDGAPTPAGGAQVPVAGDSQGESSDQQA